MKVAQLLHKLRVISNVEIVVSLLPEMPGCPSGDYFWPAALAAYYYVPFELCAYSKLGGMGTSKLFDAVFYQQFTSSGIRDSRVVDTIGKKGFRKFFICDDNSIHHSSIHHDGRF